MDIGVSADACGNLLYDVLPLCEGSTKAGKVESLWNQLLFFYEINHCKSRIQRLSLEDIKQAGKGPKLRAKGAQIRAIVPFVVSLAQKHQIDGLPDAALYRQTVSDCLNELGKIYSLMDMPLDTWPASEAAEASRRFCLLYSALSRKFPADEKRWVVKPKFHLMAELLEYMSASEGHPRLYWAYRDEDYGGWLAQLAGRRGGPRSPALMSQRLFERVMASGSLARKNRAGRNNSVK